MPKGYDDSRLLSNVDARVLQGQPLLSSVELPNASSFVGGPAIARYATQSEVTASGAGIRPRVDLHALIQSNTPGIDTVMPRLGIVIEDLYFAEQYSAGAGLNGVPGLSITTLSNAIQASGAFQCLPVGGLTTPGLRPSPASDVNRRFDLGTSTGGLTAPILTRLPPNFNVFTQGNAGKYEHLDWYLPPGSGLRFMGTASSADDDNTLFMSFVIREVDAEPVPRQGYPLE